MDYPKFIVSNQKEESISIQRVTRKHGQSFNKTVQGPLRIFSYPSVLTVVLGAQKNRPIETVLLSTHNILVLVEKEES